MAGPEVREVRCMACGRLLARWVVLSEARRGLASPRKGEPMMAERAGNRLRCKHCGGRAYLEAAEPDESLARLLQRGGDEG